MTVLFPSNPRSAVVLSGYGGVRVGVLAAGFLVAMGVALALTPAVRRAAHAIGALDHALSSRKVHQGPVPRIGGLVIATAFFVPLVVLRLVDPRAASGLDAEPRHAAALLLGGRAMVSLGALDDVRGATPRAKLAVQLGVAALMWWADFRADVVATPFGTLELGLLGFPVTVLWIVGVTNALNLVDGLDGLAGGIALLAAAAIGWVAFRNHRPLMMLFMACLGGGLLGFLRYNFNPATIFMGDSGSLFVGFVLATAALESHEPSTTAVALLVPAVALAIPIGDTLVAFTRRFVRGQPVFVPDRGHVHHRLMDRGLSHRSTVLALYGIAAVGAFASVGLVRADVEQTVAFVGALATIGIMLLVFVGYVRVGTTRRLLAERSRNLAMRAAVREAAGRLRCAGEVDDVWEVVRDTAGRLQASGVSLEVVVRNGTVKRTRFESGLEGAGPGTVRARYGLLGERPGEGGLELGFDDGRPEVDRDTEIAVELLCEHVRESVERISARKHGLEEGGAVPFRLRRFG